MKDVVQRPNRGPIQPYTTQYNHRNSEKGVLLSMQWGRLSRASPLSNARYAELLGCSVQYEHFTCQQ